MDPLTIPLAFGCILTFSQVEHAMTEVEGRALDGVVYKTVTLTDVRGRHNLLEPAVPGQGFSPGAYFHAGRSPDGLFASYVVFSQSVSHDTGDVRFVSAKTCASVRFVRVRDGATVDAAKYQGWMKDSPHSARILQRSRQYEPALPIDEARLANPGIQE
jgi:hypothetical protein